jgi:hypothetical protein
MLLPWGGGKNERCLPHPKTEPPLQCGGSFRSNPATILTCARARRLQMRVTTGPQLAYQTADHLAHGFRPRTVISGVTAECNNSEMGNGMLRHVIRFRARLRHGQNLIAATGFGGIGRSTGRSNSAGIGWSLRKRRPETQTIYATIK